MSVTEEGSIKKERLQRYVRDRYEELHHDYLTNHRQNKEAQGGKEVLQAIIEYFNLKVALWKIEDRVKKELIDEGELWLLEDE